MDFFDGLAMPQGKYLILEVVDRMSKYAHLVVVTHPCKAIMIA